MNVVSKLPSPLNTFVLDVPKDKYYDFELPPGSTYPLKGVTYPVDYGHILGYTSEDGHELDLFVGEQTDGLVGHVLVFRGEDRPDEHKFYIGLDQRDLDGILDQLKPVLIEHKAMTNIDELLEAIKIFKDKG